MFTDNDSLYRLPLNASEVRANIMDGKWSVRAQLPIPPIHTLGADSDAHAFVTYEDCIAHLLNSGAEVDFIVADRDVEEAPEDVQEFVTRLRETGRGVQIREVVGRGRLGTWIVEWSDDAGKRVH